MTLLSILLGIVIGFSLGALLTAHLILRSNDIGNSKGTYEDFAESSLKFTEKKDKIRRPHL